MVLRECWGAASEARVPVLASSPRTLPVHEGFPRRSLPDPEMNRERAGARPSAKLSRHPAARDVTGSRCSPRRLDTPVNAVGFRCLARPCRAEYPIRMPSP